MLVTGVAGFIGSHLAERLEFMGHKVIGVDCLLDNYDLSIKYKNLEQLKERNIEFINLDLSTNDLKVIGNDFDFVFHLAAQPGIDASVSFIDYEKNNIIATYRLLSMFLDSSKLSGFINISTSSVYGADATKNEFAAPKPISAYGVTKLAAEQLVLAYSRNESIKACSLRLYSVYGPRERPEKLYFKLIESLYHDKEFLLFEGSEKHIRSYTYVDDIIRANILAAKSNIDDGRPINIGNSKEFTVNQIAQMIGGPTTNIPARIEPRRNLCDNGLAKELLNWEPTMDLDKWIIGYKKELGIG